MSASSILSAVSRDLHAASIRDLHQEDVRLAVAKRRAAAREKLPPMPAVGAAMLRLHAETLMRLAGKRRRSF